jgi:hypothetical protein
LLKRARINIQQLEDTGEGRDISRVGQKKMGTKAALLDYYALLVRARTSDADRVPDEPEH